MDELLIAIILGIVQGLTEFLPISSTGHLLLGRKIFGLSEAGLFLDTMLHFGTLISIIIVYQKDVMNIVKKPFNKLTMLIIIGTIPTAIIGLSFEDYFEEISKTGVTVGWEFLLTGIILWTADNKKNASTKKIDKIKYKDAFIVGTLQGMAILPAISRSGLTIAGSLFRGINREDAAKFSFILSIPAILGAVLLQSIKIINGDEINYIASNGFIPLIVGMLTATLSGYIAVKWMIKILQKGTLKIFSYYVWMLGFIIIILQVIGIW